MKEEAEAVYQAIGDEICPNPDCLRPVVTMEGTFYTGPDLKPWQLVFLCPCGNTAFIEMGSRFFSNGPEIRYHFKWSIGWKENPTDGGQDEVRGIQRQEGEEGEVVLES